MGLTTAAIVGISAGALALGAGAGGGAVAYYNYRQQQNEIKRQRDYWKAVKDSRLEGRRVRARISSYY
jgi:hypothetical protein